MNDQTRRKLAVIAAAKAGLAPTSVYSFAEDRYTNLEAARGAWFDHGTRSWFTPEYDHRRAAHWQVELNDGAFTGFDHGAGTHFSGTVSGGAVQLYDHAEARWFNYAVYG